MFCSYWAYVVDWCTERLLVWMTDGEGFPLLYDFLHLIGNRFSLKCWHIAEQLLWSCYYVSSASWSGNVGFRKSTVQPQILSSIQSIWMVNYCCFPKTNCTEQTVTRQEDLYRNIACIFLYMCDNVICYLYYILVLYSLTLFKVYMYNTLFYQSSPLCVI